jgi:hypothetical protein
MKLINIIFLFIIINKIACLSRALYLGKSKCFYDNYYQQMNIVITYKVLDENIKLTKGNKMLFQISLMSMEKDDYKVFYGSKLAGKFSYNIEENDKYRICIESHDKDLFINKQFLRIEFKIQQSDELYDEHSAKAKDFQKVNITMQNLNSKVDSIDIMQNFQLELEDAFSKNQIKSSTRLAFLTVCQIVIICIVGIYHVFSLRKIFKDKIWAPF